jgi:hypothetical protein
MDHVVYLALFIFFCLIFFSKSKKNKNYNKRFRHKNNITRRQIIDTFNALKNHKFCYYNKDARKSAGDEGEKQLKQFILANPNFAKSPIYSSKRIFDSSISQKKEIDIIILTKKKIYIFECKNWAGKIVKFNENDEKIGYKNNNGQYEKRANPVISNKSKLYLLHKTICNNLNINLSINYFVNKIIFINKNMSYDNSLLDNQSVITYKTLSSYFSSQDTGNKFDLPKLLLNGLLKIINSEDVRNLTIEAKYGDLPYFEKVNKFLNDLPTWDYLTIKDEHGSEFTFNGDLKRYNNVFFQSINFNNVLNIEIKFSVTLLLPLIFKYSQLNAYIRWIKPINSESISKIPIKHDGTIYFHHPGEQTPREYNVIDISSIIIGNFKQV